MEIQSEPLELVYFFNTYWDALEEHGFQAAILHSWQDFPERIGSDVDYVVSAGTTRNVVAFLAEFARKHGWRLVQVIEHEPGAYYCVCVQYGGGFQQLDLDVTDDYQRIGHHLISSHDLLRDKRCVPGKNFNVPSPGAELCYIIAKAAAKKKDYSEVFQRADELVNEDLKACRDTCSRIFNIDLSNIPNSEEGMLIWLEKWFRDASFFQPIRKGRRIRLSSLLLYLRRIIRPTGLWLSIKSDINLSICNEVSNLLAPLYRRVCCVETSSLPGWLARFKLVIKTSLIVEAQSSKQAVKSSLCSWGRLGADGNDPDVKCMILEEMAMRIEKSFGVNIDSSNK